VFRQGLHDSLQALNTVEETVGAGLADLKAELGFDSIPPVTDADIEKYQECLKNKRKKAAPM
jgi:hypothetical protein